MFHHITVLSNQLVQGLQLKPGQIAVDCTGGGGGHTALMLSQVDQSGRVITFDRDSQAIRHLQGRFAESSLKPELIEAPFSTLTAQLQNLDLVGQVDAIGADFGVSSPQIDQGERGFSFSHDGPLDMRMSDTGLRADEYLASVGVSDLARVFRVYGEEPRALRIAKAVLKSQAEAPFTRTKQLADFIANASGYYNSRTHPATRCFQALRIHINQELAEIETLLEQAWAALKPGGRMAMITFHSLEDRIIKKQFQKWSSTPKLPRGLPMTQAQISKDFAPEGKIIKPFPLIPPDEEIQENPRARSAKLRVIEKLPKL
ncbi:MAG: 16S rRNA (cytosine(1402)-N(4))-methyltransferase RsmH [Oligoflexales bacterium]